jgi:hypothetical protein
MDELKSDEITKDKYFEWKITHRPVTDARNMNQEKMALCKNRTE